MKSSTPTRSRPKNRRPSVKPKVPQRTLGEAENSKETFKIQKLLANAGVASRRTIESWIQEGRVTIKGRTATLGDRVTRNARVSVDNKLIDLSVGLNEKEFLIYHKPVGEICSTNVEAGTGSLFDNLPKPETGRWVMIGRLDINTSGLLLFTNSGDEAHKYMHPKFQLEREYQVRVLGTVTPDMLSKFKKGVELEDGMAKFDKITPVSGKGGANSWFKVVLKEGRNREVRRLFESQGLTVSRLIRTRFGEHRLPRNLRPGHSQRL